MVRFTGYCWYDGTEDIERKATIKVLCTDQSCEIILLAASENVPYIRMYQILSWAVSENRKLFKENTGMEDETVSDFQYVFTDYVA